MKFFFPIFHNVCWGSLQSKLSKTRTESERKMLKKIIFHTETEKKNDNVSSSFCSGKSYKIKTFFHIFILGKKGKSGKFSCSHKIRIEFFFLPHSPNNTQPNTTEKLLREKMGKKKNEKIMYICNRTFFLEQFFLIY